MLLLLLMLLLLMLMLLLLMLMLMLDDFARHFMPQVRTRAWRKQLMLKLRIGHFGRQSTGVEVGRRWVESGNGAAAAA